MIISQLILNLLIKKYSWIIFVFLIDISSSILYAQTVTKVSLSHNFNKPLPFWHEANQLGLYNNDSHKFSTSFVGKKSLFNFGLSTYIIKNKNIKIIIPIGFVSKSLNNYELKVGRWVDKLTNESRLSSGSLILSKNSIPITKISFRTKKYNKIKILNFKLLINGGLSHGWLSKGKYVKGPLLHEKFIYFKKELKNNKTLSIGLVHEVMWGGETKIHGQQPQTLHDYIRVFTFSSGSKSSLPQEQKNTLGNHLGVWDITFTRIRKNLELKLYYQHPFEDGSGAYQYFFDELKELRFPTKSFDGLLGIEIINNKSKIFNILLYEYINTMNQSGSAAASDSTYGWDNYYNHYIYQSGWVNQNRVIGTPLFTLGSNFGHYSNLNYITNNRIKAHHVGFLGNISKKIEYKLLMTYSINYGIYYDQNRFYKENKIYKFNSGLKQFSSLFELNFKNIWENIDIQISYANDKGKLLDDAKGIILKFNYNLRHLSYSQ